jgi:hypothetical protein
MPNNNSKLAFTQKLDEDLYKSIMNFFWVGKNAHFLMALE